MVTSRLYLMLTLTLIALGSSVTLTACRAESEAIVDAELPADTRPPQPDSDYRLTPAERTLVRQGLDADAVERLLSAPR